MAARPEMTRLLEQIGKETIKGKAIHLLAASVEDAAGGGAVEAHAASGLPASPSVQVALQGLSARIKALEDAAG